MSQKFSELRPLTQFDHDAGVRPDELASEGVSRWQPHCSCGWVGEWHEAPAREYSYLPDHAEEAAQAEADEHASEALGSALTQISHRYHGRRIRVVSRAHGGRVYEGVCLHPHTGQGSNHITSIFGRCHLVLRSDSQCTPHIAAHNIVAITPLAA